MKQILRVGVLALCLGIGLSWATEASASPGFGLAPLAAPGFGAMVNPGAVPGWRSSFVELTRLKLSPSFLGSLGDLGILNQSFGAAGGLAIVVATIYIIAAIAATVALVGNIIALASRRGRFRWGLTGIICGSAALILASFFSFSSTEGLLIFLGIGSVAVGAIVLGIINMIAGIRARRGGYGGRRRYHRRRYYRRDDGPPPDMNQVGGFQAGSMFNVASNPVIKLHF